MITSINDLSTKRRELEQLKGRLNAIQENMQIHTTSSNEF